MPELILLVLYDTNKVGDVLAAWTEAGVPGVTLLESAGIAHEFSAHGARDDLPIIPSVASLLRPHEEHSRIVFSIVPDGFNHEGLIAATEQVIGSLDNPDNGILFAVPVNWVRGLRGG